MTTSTKRNRRDEPPDQFEWLTDVVTIDSEVGIYLSPTFRNDTTNPTFWHWCVSKMNPEGRWDAAGTPLHTVHSRDPWHLEASLVCHDCGVHGWIREGRWISA